MTFHQRNLQRAHACAQDNPWKGGLDSLADDLSCSIFALANVVTIMYYIVDTSTKVRAVLPAGREVNCWISTDLLQWISFHVFVSQIVPRAESGAGAGSVVNGRSERTFTVHTLIEFCGSFEAATDTASPFPLCFEGLTPVQVPNLQGDVEGKGIVRPPWLGPAVHVFNSVIAWSDLAVSVCSNIPMLRSRRQPGQSDEGSGNAGSHMVGAGSRDVT